MQGNFGNRRRKRKNREALPKGRNKIFCNDCKKQSMAKGFRNINELCQPSFRRKKLACKRHTDPVGQKLSSRKESRKDSSKKDRKEKEINGKERVHLQGKKRGRAKKAQH